MNIKIIDSEIDIHDYDLDTNTMEFGGFVVVDTIDMIYEFWFTGTSRDDSVSLTFYDDVYDVENDGVAISIDSLDEDYHHMIMTDLIDEITTVCDFMEREYSDYD